MVRTFIAFLLALFGWGTATAASITASFQQTSGTHWSVDFELTNTGVLPSIEGFTIYFPEQLFSNLTLMNSPAEWDSIVIQPEPALASAGFLDSALLNSALGLLPGQNVTGFRVEFQFGGESMPPMLRFDIVDENFNVQFTGFTSLPIPEPQSALLMLAGLFLISLARIICLSPTPAPAKRKSLPKFWKPAN